MNFGYMDNSLRKVCALILVGTIVGGVTYGQVASVRSNNANDFLRGYYYDEDVKKNRDELLDGITLGGSNKVKTLGKKKEIIPKTITR